MPRLTLVSLHAANTEPSGIADLPAFLANHECIADCDRAFNAAVNARAAQIVSEVAASDLLATGLCAGQTVRTGQPVDAVYDWISGHDINGQQAESQLRRALVLAAQGLTGAAGEALAQAVTMAAAAMADHEATARELS